MNTAHNRLLVIDDDKSFCEALAAAMSRRGFAVATAQDRESALLQARQAAPQYAIVDLRIGEDSGLPLVAELIALKSNMRVVVLTGYASIATAVEAVKLGATHYLTKPAKPDDIIAAFGREQGDPDTALTPKPMSVRRLEWEHLQRVLLEHEGNISAAARALNMHRRSLQRKLQKRPAGC